MFFVCSVPNTNPSLGPVKGNKQAVSVYDRDLGNRRTIITTPEEADEYVNNRNEAIKTARKDGLVLGLATLAGCTAAGAGIAAAISQKKFNKINELVPELNANLRKVISNSKEKFSKEFWASREVAKNFAKKGLSEFKILERYNDKIKAFTAGTNKNIKSNMAEGALFGGITGLLGLTIPDIKAENADKKITNRFIRENI